MISFVIVALPPLHAPLFALACLLNLGVTRFEEQRNTLAARRPSVQAGLRRPSQGDAWTKIDLMTQRAAAGGAQQPAQKAGEIFSVSVFRPCSDHASDLAGGGKAAKSECRADDIRIVAG
jgi:hypothetical protein